MAAYLFMAFWGWPWLPARHHFMTDRIIAAVLGWVVATAAFLLVASWVMPT